MGGATFEDYDYDALSRMSKAVNDFSTVEMTYDPLNRLTQEKQNGKIINYTYSVVNNLRKMTMQYPNQRIVEKDFDILDRISKIRQGQETIANFSYIGKSYRMLNQQFGNGNAVNYLYDQGRHLTSKETKNQNQGLINKYVYGYNRVGMKMFEQRGHDNNKGDAYSYDEVYRLTGVKFNSPDPQNPGTTLFEKQKAINLDKVHNIMNIVESQDGLTKTINNVIPDGSNYSKLNQYERFDQWGLTYDLNGNTTQRGTQHLTYDYRNQVVRVVGVNATTDFKYDPLGRRVQKNVISGSQSKITNFYYSGQQVIEERDGNDNVLNQYVYGNGIDEIIRMDKYNGTTAIPYYYHTNAIGSVISVTDADGNVVERNEYDIYGMPTFKDAAGNVISKSSIGNNILFQGREYDEETNLYYYRARYYDPIMGRFLQTDPMGYKDSMNLYQAFGMNPVNFMDPLGERIYFTGKDKESDFQAFKNIFKNIIKKEYKDIIDQILTLKEQNGQVYVDLIGGKSTLKNIGLKYGRNRDFNKNKFFNWVNKTTNLKKYPGFFKMELEELFEFIIFDERRIPIDFKSDYSERVMRAGGGITDEPYIDTKTGHSEVKVAIDFFDSEKNINDDFRLYAGPNVKFFDPQVVIVHEFGHALANMLGWTSEDGKESIFWELAIMMENLYRIRNEKSWLRGSHNYGDQL